MTREQLRRRAIADRLDGLVQDLDRYVTDAFDAGDTTEATRLHIVRGHVMAALGNAERDLEGEEAPRAG